MNTHTCTHIHTHRCMHMYTHTLVHAHARTGRLSSPDWHTRLELDLVSGASLTRKTVQLAAAPQRWPTAPGAQARAALTSAPRPTRPRCSLPSPAATRLSSTASPLTVSSSFWLLSRKGSHGPGLRAAVPSDRDRNPLISGFSSCPTKAQVKSADNRTLLAV